MTHTKFTGTTANAEGIAAVEVASPNGASARVLAGQAAGQSWSPRDEGACCAGWDGGGEPGRVSSRLRRRRGPRWSVARALANGA